MKSRRSKATDISQKVKDEVYKRDKGCCIICGSPGQPNSHYIRRSAGGLGIPENVVTMCMYCHNAYDNGYDSIEREYIKSKTKKYLESIYDNWNEEDLIFNKWR